MVLRLMAVGHARVRAGIGDTSISMVRTGGIVLAVDDSSTESCESGSHNCRHLNGMPPIELILQLLVRLPGWSRAMTKVTSITHISRRYAEIFESAAEDISAG